MHQWIKPSLIQIMACCLFGAKPLPESVLTYCQLDPGEQTSVKFWSNYNNLHLRKLTWKYLLQNGNHSVSAWDNSSYRSPRRGTEEVAERKQKHGQVNMLTHFPHVSHICVRETGRQWFRYWLVACFAPSHYLNQCWVIFKWTLRNKLQWNFNENKKLSIHENASEYFVCNKAAIFQGEMS